ncbi:MAG: response regulator [Candidatus Binatia bacterium]
MTKVLIVDDDESNRYYLKSLLEGRGWEVRTASHGEEALAATRSFLPALVVSDLLMPVMDGYTLLRHWKSNESLRDIPFVVYTATYTDAQDEKLALKLGADAFLIKPAEPEVLSARLDEVLERRAAGPAPAPAPEVSDPGGETETVILRQYNQALIRKLEDKMAEAEATSHALARNIAERVRIEKELRESEGRFRQLAESVLEVFWMSDPDRAKVLYVSPAYERVWGRSCASAVDEFYSWFDAIHPDDREAVRELTSSRRTVGQYEHEYRIVRPDGSLRWVRERAFPVREDDGVVRRIAGVTEDITERKEIEQSRRVLEEQLQRAQKMDAIGTLAGGIAHDFNNILAAILGNAELAAMDDKLSQGTRRSLEEITRAGQRARRLVQQILTFSRKNTTELSVVSLGAVVEEAVHMLRSTLPAGIRVEFTAGEALPNILADSVQVHQILLNLGTNAWHAIEGDSGSIVIRVDSVAGEDREALSGSRVARFARLVVKDDGVGMDEATKGRIFEPFFTTKPAGSGTGLGLSVVHGAVEALGGTISVTSEPGKGTAFEILFPESVERAEPDRAAPTRPSRGQGEHVLYLDDEEALVFLAVRMLTQHGYRVSGFARADDALAALRADPDGFDLVVTDYNMPQVSGLQVAREVLKLRPNLPVVMASGYVTEELKEQCAAVGIVQLLEKPDTIDGICSAVEQILGPRDASRKA